MRDKLFSALLGISLLGLVYIGVLARSIHRTVEDLALIRGDQMEPATTKWFSRGLEVSVTTIQNAASVPPETEAEWAARHRRRVDAMLKDFPQDPR